jgi:hypothetical protein
MLTVKKLIEKLQAIDNKFLEVYVIKGSEHDAYHAIIKDVAVVNKKCLIFIE